MIKAAYVVNIVTVASLLVGWFTDSGALSNFVHNPADLVMASGILSLVNQTLHNMTKAANSRTNEDVAANEGNSP